MSLHTTSVLSSPASDGQIDKALPLTTSIRGGRLQYKRGKHHKQLNYYLHLPEHMTEGAPVLVAVHGISRNAREQAVAFGNLASRFGFVVIAPHFIKSRFPAYQRLGFKDGEYISEPAGALLSVLDEVAATTGANTSKVYMFGYSGGGQFVHRFVMKYPHRIRKTVLGAPGWLTFPEVTTTYPRGLSGAPGFDPNRFLRIPTLLLVGDLDRERDPALNTSIKLDGQQGRNRVERGKRWVAAMRRAAQLRAIPGHDFRFGLMDDCGHSFVDCSRRGQVVLRSMLFFLETRASRASTELKTGCLVFSTGGECGRT